MNDPYGNHEFSLSTFLSDKDVLTRHKWPKEKPEEEKDYLVRCVSSNSWNEVVYWRGGCFFTDKRCLRKAFNDAITHWWELPEVKE